MLEASFCAWVQSRYANLTGPTLTPRRRGVPRNMRKKAQVPGSRPTLEETAMNWEVISEILNKAVAEFAYHEDAVSFAAQYPHYYVRAIECGA